MIWAFVKAYWKQLLIVAMLAALVIGGVVAWNVHGDRQYDAGYAKAQADQKQADDKARHNVTGESTNEREAHQRIDQARNDAEHANSAADGLQLRARCHPSDSARNAGLSALARQPQTPVLLADVLEKSLDRNRSRQKS
jgi:hypothetical protein